MEESSLDVNFSPLCLGKLSCRRNRNHKFIQRFLCTVIAKKSTRKTLIGKFLHVEIKLSVKAPSSHKFSRKRAKRGKTHFHVIFTLN